MLLDEVDEEDDTPAITNNLPEINTFPKLSPQINWAQMQKSFDFKRHIFPDDFDQERGT
jgi:hypothetical protein